MFLDVTRSLLGCYRFAVALRALVALAPSFRLDLFSYLDKRRSLTLRHFFNSLNLTQTEQAFFLFYFLHPGIVNSLGNRWSHTFIKRARHNIIFIQFLCAYEVSDGIGCRYLHAFSDA